MKAEKQLIKVVGSKTQTMSNGKIETTIARGIAPLKQDSLVFIAEFMKARGIDSFSLNQRGDLGEQWATNILSFLADDKKFVLTKLAYHFTRFPLSDLGHFSKDLSKEELDRDFKTMKRILK